MKKLFAPLVLTIMVAGCENSLADPASLAYTSVPPVELDSTSIVTEYQPPYPIHVHYLSVPHDIIAEAVDRAVKRWAEILGPTPLESFEVAGSTGCGVPWEIGEVAPPGLHLFIEPTYAGGAAGVAYSCLQTRHASQKTYAAGIIGLDGPEPGYDGWDHIRDRAIESWFSVTAHEIGHIVMTGKLTSEQRCDSAGANCKYLYWSEEPAVVSALDRLLEGTFPGRGAPSDRSSHWAGCIAWTGYWKPNTCQPNTVGAKGCSAKNKVWDIMTTGQTGTAITEITLGALHSGYRYNPASADPYIANFDPQGLPESTVWRGLEYWKQCPEFVEP